MSNTIELTITGMSCGGCVNNAETHLKGVDGVDSVMVRLDDGKAVVTGSADSEALIAAVKAAGYQAEVSA